MSWMALAGAAASAASQYGSGKGKYDRVSTMSSEQKAINKQLFDFLQGVTRKSSGKVTDMEPLIDKLKDIPYRKIAGLTDRQKQVLARADQIRDRQNSYLRPGEDPRVHFAALGAVAGPGDTIVVGEDGPEMLHVQPDGSVVIEPNPKSIENPQDAQAKSDAVKAKLGADKGMAAGGTITGQSKYANIGDSWYDLDELKGFSTGNKPGDDVLGEYNSYLKSGYDNYMSTFDKKNASWNTNGSMLQNPNEWNWYEQFNKIGGTDKLVYKPAQGRWIGSERRTYVDKFGEWLDTLETGTSNPYLDNTVGSYDDDKASEFNQWVKDQKYNDASSLQLSRNVDTDKYSLENPFQYGNGSLDEMFGRFDEYYTTKQQTDQANTGMRNEILAKLGSDYSGFNDYLGEYNSGVLANQGVAWNPESGDWELAAGDDILGGLNVAADDYLTDIQNRDGLLAGLGNSSITADDLTRDSSGNWIVDPSKYAMGDTGQWSAVEAAPATGVGSDNYLQTISDALGGYLEGFDTEQVNNDFDSSIYDPTMEKFNSETVAAIDQQFGADDQFGSQRQKTIGSARGDLEDQLAASRSDYVSQMRQVHEAQGLNAAQSMMSLATLPEQIRGLEADNEYKSALTDQVFKNAEWTDALMNSSLDMQEANTLAILWQLYGMEQQQDQSQLDTDMANWLQGNTGGLDFAGLLSLFGGYMSESQVAAVTY